MFADNAQANQSEKDKQADEQPSRTSKLDSIKFREGSSPIRETLEESSRVTIRGNTQESKLDVSASLDKKVPKIDFNS